MSMMKPVDNHTTSIGMTEIMGGSRTGRFTRDDNSRSISVASDRNGSFLSRVASKNLAQEKECLRRVAAQAQAERD
jgi:hypothetical protein